jgi:5-methyltetrahydrofolate--homocysteine methyltransferase
MSSLLTTSMSSMGDTIHSLKNSGLRDTVRVMVGGAPVTQDFASKVGADGYAKDAASAVDKAKELVRRFHKVP